MTLTITPTGATLGAIVTGVDLANLNDASWADIERAFLAYAVLIFPSQHLSEAEQIRFGRRFGRIEQLVADREIVPISNQRHDGTLLKDDDFGMQLMRGNEGWHTDSSYMPWRPKPPSCQRMLCLRLAGRPSGRTCAPPTTHSTRRPKRTSLISRPITRCTIRKAASATRLRSDRVTDFTLMIRRCVPW